MKKQCERCKKNFDCHAEDILNCNCRTVQLNASERQYIRNLGFSDCLCNSCLPLLKTQAQNSSDTTIATVFVKGKDYYIENGFYVFTGDYLKRRGYCCKNGCRHCPYGFKGK